MKLYVVVGKALSAGLKAAQACHAMHAFTSSPEHTDIVRTWEQSNNIVVLQVENLPTLADRLERAGVEIARFHEPDLDGQLTAICVEPAARRHVARLQLAA
jgi:peptidyl-tRNA hydrolase